MRPVTDPALLAELEGGGPKAVSDPAILAQLEGKKAPGDLSVAVNSINKGLAGIPDTLLNLPTNVINLGKAAVGVPMIAMGRPDLAPEPSAPPNLANRGMKALGLINDANDPANARQRVIDAMMQGGAGMLVNPAKGGADVLKNVAMGVAGGGVGGATQEATGSEAAAIAASALTPLAPSAAMRAVVGKPRAMNDVKRQTLVDAEAKGYKVPISETNDSFVNNRLESVAGKAALKQDLQLKNQGVTNELAAQELGLPKGTAITVSELDKFRAANSQPYRDIADLSPASAKNLEKLKEARAEASSYYKFYDRTADPKALKEAKAFDAQAKVIETELEKVAARRGQPDLVDQLREARQKIAKSYDIERALNKGAGEVSAPALGTAFDKGKPLSGNLKTIGAFDEAFPQYTGEGVRVPTPGVSKSEAIVSALMGMGGTAAFGPEGAAAAAIPLASHGARRLITSDAYRNMMRKPAPGMTKDDVLQSILLARAIAERNQQ